MSPENVPSLRGTKIFVVIKYRFIVFKMTAQIKVSQQNKTKIEKKCKGAEKLVRTCPRSPNTTTWPNFDSFF